MIKSLDSNQLENLKKDILTELQKDDNEKDYYKIEVKQEKRNVVDKKSYYVINLICNTLTFEALEFLRKKFDRIDFYPTEEFTIQVSLQ